METDKVRMTQELDKCKAQLEHLQTSLETKVAEHEDLLLAHRKLRDEASRSCSLILCLQNSIGSQTAWQVCNTLANLKPTPMRGWVVPCKRHGWYRRSLRASFDTASNRT